MTYTSATTSQGYYLELTLTETVNAPANTSSIAYTLKMYSGSYYFSTVRIGYSLAIDGTTVGSRAYADSNYYNLSAHSNITLATGTFTVKHNDDGTKKISSIVFKSLTATGNLAPNITGTGSNWTLTPIPRASSMTTSGNRIGNAISFTINPSADTFQHSITYVSGGTTYTAVSKTSQTSVSYTLPYSLCANIDIEGGATTLSVTFTLHTWSGSTEVGTSTNTVTLNSPAAGLSFGTITMGSSATINISEQASTFKHTLSYSFLGTGAVAKTGTIVTETTATSVTWAVPATLGENLRSTKSSTITITQRAYQGAQLVAKKVYNPTIYASSVAPYITIGSTAAVDTPFSGVYVQDNSKVKVTCTFNASGTGAKSYAYIASASATIEGKVYAFNVSGTSTTATNVVITSALLTTSGSHTITIKVTDSRGYTRTSTTTITVQAYEPPRLLNGYNESKIIVARCLQDGTLSNSGTYLKIKVGRRISTVSSNNTGYIAYKVNGGAETLLSTSGSGDYYISPSPISGFAVTNTYTITIRAYDTVGNEAVRTFKILSETVTLDLRQYGKGVGIGMFSQGNNRFDVAWDSYFQGNLYIQRIVSELSATNGGYTMIRPVPRWNYDDILSGTDSFPASNYLTAWLKKVAETYPTATQTTYVGNVVPLNVGFVACYVQSCADVSGGLPQTSVGIYVPYNEVSSANRGAIVRFGTSSYTFWYDVILPQVSKEISLSYSTNNIVTSANFSSGVKLYQSGKACALHIQFTPTSTSGGSSYVTIGTIPSGSRPQQQVDVATHLDSTTFRLIDLRVTTSGNIQVYKNNTYTQTLRGNLAWITA